MSEHKHYAKSSSLCIYTDYLIADDAEQHAGEMVKKHGGSRVLLVYDQGVKLLGLDKAVQESLSSAGLYYTEMPDGVLPNPRRSLMEKGVDLAKAENIDFVLGIGGGSTIDTAKAIAVGMKYDGPVWDVFAKHIRPSGNAPVGSIPTIAASGSESSRASVILDDIDTQRKIGTGFPSNRPVFCLLNPKLTFTVPAFQTACGACDAFGHTFNRFYFQDYSALGDEFAAAQMRTVIKYAPIAVREPENYEARRELLLSATFGHNDITELGRGGPHGGAHELLDYLTFVHGAPHGMTVAMAFAPWLEWMVDTGDEGAILRTVKFANLVLGIPVDPEDLAGTARRAATGMRDFVRSCGLPTTFKEYFEMTGRDVDVDALDLDEVASYAGYHDDGKVEGYIPLTHDDVVQVIKNCLK